jgi:pimeloyl-ACP methyl ester carboxylesterase
VEGPREATSDDRRSRTVVLPDGHRLGYAEWGDPDGWPVLFFHGTPASRLGFEWAEDAAAEYGARLLSLDRPGHGLSDRAPGRTLLDWSRDVTDFADALGLATFAIAGWSGGGPYVLACASAIPDRLSGAAVLSGCGPLDTAAARCSVSSLDRTMLTLSTRTPLVARLIMNQVVLVVRHAPRLALKGLEQDLSDSDCETFRRLNPDARWAMDFFLEAFRSGTAGVIDDYRVLATPWDFAPEDIDIRVNFWHGDQDRMASLQEAQAVVARMPDARLVVVPGEGHMLLMDHFREVLATLAPDRLADPSGRPRLQECGRGPVAQW